MKPRSRHWKNPSGNRPYRKSRRTVSDAKNRTRDRSLRKLRHQGLDRQRNRSRRDIRRNLWNQICQSYWKARTNSNTMSIPKRDVSQRALPESVFRLRKSSPYPQGWNCPYPRLRRYGRTPTDRGKKTCSYRYCTNSKQGTAGLKN